MSGLFGELRGRAAQAQRSMLPCAGEEVVVQIRSSCLRQPLCERAGMHEW